MAAFGILLLSAAWLAWFPVFTTDPAWGLGIVFALIGGGLMVASSADQPGAGRKREWLRQFRSPAAYLPCLAILSAQFFVLHLFRSGAANHHELPSLAPVIALLARCIGIHATADGAMVFVATEEDVIPFLTNWEKVGLVMPLSLGTAWALYSLLSESTLRRRIVLVAVHLGVLSAYVVVRYLALCMWLIEVSDARGMDPHERLEIFTGFWPTLLTYLPLAWLLWRLRTLRNTAVMPSLRIAPWRAIGFGTVGLTSGVALAVIAAGWTQHRSGPPRPGEILWSDFHSGFWEPSRPLLDTKGYGSDHLYNASSLVEWLRYHLPIRVHTNGPVTADLLRNVSVFVLKTPIRRLSAEEIEVMVKWVEEGGGLLLVGDHTNLLGMSSYLNELAGRFGIEFQLDGSNAYSSGYFSHFHSPLLGAHPIVEGLAEVRFLTSCTLRYRDGAHPVMVASDVLSDPVDYSKPSFFGRLTVSPQNGFGMFPLAVARHYGRGAVVAFAESTTLSNFAAFQDATPEFYLRVLSHLSRPARGARSTAVLMAIVACALAGAGIFLSRPRRWDVLLIAAALAAAPGWACGKLFLKVYHIRTQQWPAAAQPISEVGFLTGPAYAWELPPAIGPMLVAPEYSFDALFVTPQRFGAFPRLLRSGIDHGTHWKAVVVVNPNTELPTADRGWLNHYVAAGGHLILVQGTTSEAAELPQWLTGTNQARLRAGDTVTLGNPGSGDTSVPSAPPRPVLRWSIWDVNGGRVSVLAPAAALSRAGVGNVMAEPDAAQMALYRLLYRALGESLGAITRTPL